MKNAYLCDVYSIVSGFFSILISMLTIFQLNRIVPKFKSLYTSLNMEIPWLTGIYIDNRWIITSILCILILLSVYSMARLSNKYTGMYISIACLVMNIAIAYISYFAISLPIENLQKQLS